MKKYNEIDLTLYRWDISFQDIVLAINSEKKCSFSGLRRSLNGFLDDSYQEKDDKKASVLLKKWRNTRSISYPLNVQKLENQKHLSHSKWINVKHPRRRGCHQKM